METFSTPSGTVWRRDCLDFLLCRKEAYDLVFADPPFNLGKQYPSGMDDAVAEQEYRNWCGEWIRLCADALKPGGSLFIWTLPKWGIHNASCLERQDGIKFRNWIAVKFSTGYPIKGRLFPAHYALLYVSKGKPKAFHPDRIPVEICHSCFSELHDYGGHRNALNPDGMNLSDIWTDISPVRHMSKKHREANELPLKLLDRIVSMASDEGDLVFDPFGGTGTTFAVCEMLGRRWEGTEIGPLDSIAERLSNPDLDREALDRIHSEKNCLFTPEAEIRRRNLGLWTAERKMEGIEAFF